MAHDERSRALLEVFRVLRAGGRLIVIDQIPRGGSPESLAVAHRAVLR